MQQGILEHHEAPELSCTFCRVVCLRQSIQWHSILLPCHEMIKPITADAEEKHSNYKSQSQPPTGSAHAGLYRSVLVLNMHEHTSISEPCWTVTDSPTRPSQRLVSCCVSGAEESHNRSMSQQKPFIKEVAIQYCAAQGPGFSGPAPAAAQPASNAKPADKAEAKVSCGGVCCLLSERQLFHTSLPKSISLSCIALSCLEGSVLA